MSFDLSTDFGGLKLKSPLAVGSCPIAANELQRISMVSNGAGAIVLPSFFEEQFVIKSEVTESPQTDLDSYLMMVKTASKQSTTPLIASINGHYSVDWRHAACKIAASGANGLEFGIRQADIAESLDPREVEDGIVRAVQQIKSSIDIPLFVKLTRRFTSITNLVGRLRPHISGVILFGRSPVIDVELDCLKQTSKWNLTESETIVNSLEPIMQLRQQYPDLSIAACGGIGTSTDLIKALLVGANITMVTSVIYRDGTTVIGSLLQGLAEFMQRKNLCSMAELADLTLTKGSCLPAEPQPNARTPRKAFEPAQTGDRFGHVKTL